MNKSGVTLIEVMIAMALLLAVAATIVPLFRSLKANQQYNQRVTMALLEARSQMESLQARPLAELIKLNGKHISVKALAPDLFSVSVHLSQPTICLSTLRIGP
ncbi:hypothetical protein A2311_05745 [candidate division WOR-1 bacterium RIFOXYB2_FULL_48_7]|uniref:Prepilin-type N-terminal cleavage/methylation domain-containing protein n=1 Tax=candidate division WOR-1 bacterium RIFOXYB2_FULL_48_7 TaxID=1802583 RepID=A0A1F4TU21_UNCSA|nr:MAG: hypothetical protein A2311_05745 [candidate division WOR-1 bacterium RIFOXYB2_FULL_48_7]